MSCAKHSKYEAKRQPQVPCAPCWEMWITRLMVAEGWLSPEEAEKLREKAEHPIHVAELGWLAPEPARQLAEAAHQMVSNFYHLEDCAIYGTNRKCDCGTEGPDVEGLADALSDPAVQAILSKK